ncbi:MAG: prepilin-type N-terminal cleavage/methylation domain-containing protein [Phycisphaerae bacterium]|nr:prepilin-type N-terminal cleavage/methylation domain-containing protein [Phycisphaerae bacterium]
MRNKTEQSRPGSVSGRSRAGAAFTLVELIVVMFIIGLLMALLVPTIGYTVRLSLSVGAKTRVHKLANAAEGYKMKTGYYPGQRDTSQLDTYTGSQILAACVFDYLYEYIETTPFGDETDPNYPRCYPKSTYCGYEEDESLETLNDEANTLSDGFWVESMAICYYVSWPGQTGTGQFHETDNDEYTTGNIADGEDFTTFITDPSYGLPYNDKEFLLISAGPDREFFSDDDATNWEKAE